MTNDTHATVLLTVDEAAARLNVARSHLYRFIANGSLASVKIGRSRRIPAQEISRFVSRLLEASLPDVVDRWDE